MSDMIRRDFITLLAGAAAWPLAARAQQAAKVPRIGYLGGATPSAQGQQKSAKLAHLLQTLSPASDRSLWSPEISRVLISLHALENWAKATGPKRKKSNRARPDDLDEYLNRFVRFYASRIGYPGKAPTSPCVRFIISAAAPPLGHRLTPGSVSDLIRTRVHTLIALDLTTGSPEFGMPALQTL